MYTQMRRCHKYMPNSVDQGPFLVAGAWYKIFQNFWEEQTRLVEHFHTGGYLNRRISNRSKY
jgi:hypothetical protein